MYRTLHTREQEILVGLLREVREQAGLRQAELAERLGQHQSFVSRAESGQRRIDLVELGQICDALEIGLVDFVRRYDKARASA